MNSSLFINPPLRDRILFTRDTVIAMTAQVALQFPGTWSELIRRVQKAKNFAGVQLTEKKSTRLKAAYTNRLTWLHRNAPNTLVDYRSPVMGENEDDMVFSESENETDADLDNENTEYDSDDDVFDY